jgi:hypothetical protein
MIHPAAAPPALPPARFVPPAVLGFVRQLPGLSLAVAGKPNASATLTLLARRGVDRAGTRQWRRGCDSAGAAPDGRALGLCVAGLGREAP